MEAMTISEIPSINEQKHAENTSVEENIDNTNLSDSPQVMVQEHGRSEDVVHNDYVQTGEGQSNINSKPNDFPISAVDHEQSNYVDSNNRGENDGTASSLSHDLSQMSSATSLGQEANQIIDTPKASNLTRKLPSSKQRNGCIPSTQSTHPSSRQLSTSLPLYNTNTPRNLLHKPSQPKDPFDYTLHNENTLPMQNNQFTSQQEYLEHHNEYRMFRYPSKFSSPFRTPSRNIEFRYSSDISHTQSNSSSIMSEPEWTAQDSAYGAACPICGCIPKSVRKAIEFTLVSSFIMWTALFIISTSYKIGSESRLEDSDDTDIMVNSGSNQSMYEDDYYNYTALVDDA